MPLNGPSSENRIGDRRRGGGVTHLASSLWIVAVVLALHWGNPVQDIRIPTSSATLGQNSLGLSAGLQPDQPYADLRNVVRFMAAETRSLLTKSTETFSGSDDPTGHVSFGSSRMAFGGAPNAPPAGSAPPAAATPRAFQQRAPPSLLA